MLHDRERILAFSALMHSVAAELTKLETDGWVYSPQRDIDDQRELSYGTLVAADGLELSVSGYRDGYRASAKERVKVSVNWPRAVDGGYRRLRDWGVGRGGYEYNAAEPEMTVSMERDAAAIAKDIRRKLIEGEDVRALRAKVLERLQKALDNDRAQEKLGRELFALAGEPYPERSRPGERAVRLRLYEYAPGVSYGDLEVRAADSVKIEVNVDGEVAREFLKLLNARKVQEVVND